MDFLLLKILLVMVCTIQGAQSESSWYSDMKWCYHEGTQLFTGDFNGDGRADMLCLDSKGGVHVALANSAGQFPGNSWYKAMGWCSEPHNEVHVGDFNGDGRTDMVCHDSSSGDVKVALANSAGQFTGTAWEKAMGWCFHEGANLKVGDFNGDGRDDMLCQDGTHMWVSTGNADGSFTGNSWHEDRTWCNQGNGAEVYVGDFNNDKRDDLLCHDNAGTNSVKLAKAGGSFTVSNDWSSSTPFCAGQDFHVGDMNGDGRADMVCNDKTSGKTSISFANAVVNNLFGGTSTNGRTRVCSGNKALFLADFNGDHRDDMLCHSYATGEKWIDYTGSEKVVFKKLGCFKDTREDRALNQLIGIFRQTFDKNKAMKTAIEPCAEKAKKRGYHYFGVHYDGECWSSPDKRASKRYNIHGPSSKCKNGIGSTAFEYMAYKITS